MALSDRIEEAQILKGWYQHFGMRWTLDDCAVTNDQIRLQAAGTVDGWQWIWTPKPYPRKGCPKSWAFDTLDELLKYREELAA